jgi:hypothetical protein
MRRTNGRTKLYQVLRPLETADGRGGYTMVATALVPNVRERGSVQPIQTGEHVRGEKDGEKFANLDLIGNFRFGANIQLNDILKNGTAQFRVTALKNPGDRGHLAQVNLQEIQGASHTS